MTSLRKWPMPFKIRRNGKIGLVGRKFDFSVGVCTKVLRVLAALPFSKNPDQHPSFKLYFSKDWADAFFVTLHNFFSTLFACLPLPALLNFEAEHQKMQVLSTENQHLHMHLATTRQALAEAESTVQRLEGKLAQQEAKLAQQEAKLAHQVANQAAIKRR